MAEYGDTKVGEGKDKSPILASDIDAKIHLLIDWNNLSDTMQKAIKRMNDEIVELKKYKKFHDHIKAHLNPNCHVICKICNKTYEEIII